MASKITLSPLREAVSRIADKTPVGSKLRTAEWERVPLDLAERAFFSAGVESVRFLADAKKGIEDILSFAREQTRGGDALIDRGSLIARLREVARREGIPVDPRKAGGLQDITSRARLSLIVDTNLAQAREFARWKAEQDPDILDAFPAQELVRIESRELPRRWLERWVQAGGTLYAGRMIAAKNSPIWSRISRFRTPWPPFDFRSGMGLEDISREEAESLGVIAPGDSVAPAEADFNSGLEASVRGLGDREKAMLKSVFGNQIEIAGDTVRWTGQRATPPRRPVVVPPPAPVTPPPAPAPEDPFAAVEPKIEALIKEADVLQAELEELKRSPDIARSTEVAEKLAALNERARELVSVPVKERKSVAFRNLPKKTRASVLAGGEIVSRFVHPDLVPQGVGVETLRGSRAFFRAGTRTLHINSRTSVSVIAHEITHDIEFQHPEVVAKTKAFLAERGGKEAPQQLRKLTGNPGYKPDEIAYKDEWEIRGGSVYAGKVYPYSATELLTMGIERLQAAPLDFAKRDPGYFKFLVGTLRKW